MKKIVFLFTYLLFFACAKKEKEQADLLVFNGDIYTVDESFGKAEAFVVKDGKFIEVGTHEQLKEKYTFSEAWDAKGKTIVPGLIDAHCHFYNLGLAQNRINLRGTKSFDEVVQKIIDFQDSIFSEWFCLDFLRCISRSKCLKVRNCNVV